MKTPHAARSAIIAWTLFWGASSFIIISAWTPLDDIYLIDISDKLAHTLEYFFLTLFSLHAFSIARRGHLRAHSARYAILYCVTVALFTEIGQSFVPTRSPELLDGAANMFGVGLGCAVYWIVTKKTKLSEWGASYGLF